MTPEEAIAKIDNKPIKTKRIRKIPVNSIEKLAKTDYQLPLVFITIAVMCLLIIFHLYRVNYSYMQGYTVGVESMRDSSK